MSWHLWKRQKNLIMRVDDQSALFVMEAEERQNCAGNGGQKGRTPVKLSLNRREDT